MSQDMPNGIRGSDYTVAIHQVPLIYHSCSHLPATGMVQCIWQRGYNCRCHDRLGSGGCPTAPAHVAIGSSHVVQVPGPKQAPAQGKLFSFKSGGLATKLKLERRRSLLVACGLSTQEVNAKLTTRHGPDNKARFTHCFAICGCHFSMGSLLEDKVGRIRLRPDARPLTLRQMNFDAEAQAMHIVESSVASTIDSADLAEGEAKVGRQKQDAASRQLMAEKRKLRAEIHEMQKRLRYSDEAAGGNVVDNVSTEILRVRTALRQVPVDSFPYTYKDMTDLLQNCDAHQLQAFLMAGTVRDHHDGKGAHTADITQPPKTPAEKTTELRACFALAMYIFASTTRDVPLRKTLTCLKTEAKATQEMATGRLGVTLSPAQRKRDDRAALANYDATQYDQWRADAVRVVDDVQRFLATVLWDDDYMR